MSKKTRPAPCEVRVVNVVASTRLSREVRLQAIAETIGEDASYDPEHFSGMIYRRSDPRATVILFGNGKFVSTGTTSEAESKLALRRTLDEIVRAEGKPATMAEVQTVNLVATADLGGELDLNRLLPEFPEASYEPEQFPGMMIQQPDHSVCLLFGSGKVVCSGARSEKAARQHIVDLRQRLVTLRHLHSRVGHSLSVAT